jgi:hypothetical protein
LWTPTIEAHSWRRASTGFTRLARRAAVGGDLRQHRNRNDDVDRSADLETIEADAERQRQQRHGGEGGAFQQRAPGVADVPQELVDELRASHIAALLLALFEAIHGAQGG